jgi:hypothetical protein
MGVGAGGFMGEGSQNMSNVDMFVGANTNPNPFGGNFGGGVTAFDPNHLAKESASQMYYHDSPYGKYN